MQILPSVQNLILNNRFIWVNAPASAPVSATETGERQDEPLEFTTANLLQSASKFRGLFGEIGEHMIEREEAISQLALALLAPAGTRSHMLMIGHPGTAKSTLGRMGMQMIRDSNGRTSVFDKQLHTEIKASEVLGPSLPRVNTAGVTEFIRQFHRGIAPYELAILDEMLDAPSGVLRGALLTVLLDGVVADGDITHPCNLQTAFGASNKTLEQLAAKWGDDLDALLDRFSFIFWTPKRNLRSDSGVKIITQATRRSANMSTGTSDKRNMGLEKAPLTFAELALLKKATVYVRQRMAADGWPLELASGLYATYHKKLDDRAEEFGRGRRRSKLESQRSMAKLADMLSAIATLRYVNDPSTKLGVVTDDFSALRLSMMMRGPVIADIPSDPDIVKDQTDASVLKRLKIEDEVFEQSLREVVGRHTTAAGRRTPRDLSPIIGIVYRAHANATQNPPAPMTIIGRNIDELGPQLAVLETVASQTPIGEEAYMRAVLTFVKLLTLAASDSSLAAKAKEQFSLRIEPCLPQLRNSFLCDGLSQAMAEFGIATRKGHAAIAAKPRKIADVLAHLRDIVADEKVLGAETVRTLTDTVKTACLTTIGDGRYEALIATSDYHELLKEVDNLGSMQSQLLDHGINGKIPLDQVLAMQQKRLQFMARALKSIRAALLAARSGVPELLDDANVLVEHYAQNMSHDLTPAIDARNLPESYLRAFGEAKKADKQAQAGTSAKVEGVVTESPDSTGIQINWQILEQSEFKTDPAELRKSHNEFCTNATLEKDRLIALPAVAKLVSSAVEKFKIYMGNSWNDRYEEVAKDDVLNAITKCLHTQQDTAIRFSFGKADVACNLTVSYSDLKADFEGSVAKATGDDDLFGKFLEQLGFSDTPANRKALRDALKPSGTATGPVMMERCTESVDKYLSFDVKNHFVQLESPKWASWHTQIAGLIGDLKHIAAGHVGKTLPQIPAVVVKPEDLIKKCGMVKMAGTTLDTAATRWTELGIQAPTNLDSMAQLEQNEKTLLSGLPIDPEKGMHACMEEMVGVENRIITLFCPASDDKIARNGRVGQDYWNRVNAWATQRTQRLQKVRTDLAALNPSDFTAMRISNIRKTANFMFAADGRGIFGEPDTTAMADIRARFGTDPAAEGALKKTVIGERFATLTTVLEAFCDGVTRYEIPGRFKMDDLSTITQANAATIDNVVRSQVNAFERLDQMLTIADDEVKLNGADIAPQLTAQLAAIKAKKDTVQRAYLSKLLSLGIRV